MRAIIVGAGIAGLSAAVTLTQIGWESLVVERAPRRRNGGYGVFFGGIGYDAAERMGILPRLLEKSFVTNELVYHKPNGERHFSLTRETIAATMGSRTINILRGDLEAVLYGAVRDPMCHAVEVRFGTSISAVRQDQGGVDVTLSDGSVEHADLLIGADGLHSTTRALVFGPEEDFRVDLDHMVAVYMLGVRPAAVAEGTTGSLSTGGRTVAVVSVGDGRNVAFFGYRSGLDGDRTAGDTAREALPRVYRDVGWAVPEALAGLATAESVYFDTISQIVTDTWSRGRVVLLGDAAWCVTLFAGYGSALAVGGADLLGAKLSSHPGDIEQALARWEDELRPEVEKKQKLGRRVKGVYAPVNPLALWLSRLPLRLAGLGPVRNHLKRRYIKG